MRAGEAIAAMLIAGLLAPACGERREPMEKGEQIRVASEYARQHGYDTSRYDVRSVKTEGGAALVFFHGKSGRPGDHFTVLIDLASGKATEIVPGN